MYTLPNDMILNIFNFIKLITDKRQFIKTCNRFNTTIKHVMKQSEDEFIEMHIDNINDYGIKMVLPEDCIYTEFKTNNYCVEKFTLELCYDSYFNLIPKSYLNAKNKILMDALAVHGQLDLLKIAVDNGCLVNNKMCAHAASRGHLDIIKWAFDNGNNFNGIESDSAALYGHLDIVEYLWKISKRGMKNYFSTQTSSFAAMNGHLHILNWIQENDPILIEKDKQVFEVAAIYGHLNVIKWGYEHRFTFSKSVFVKAVEYGQLDIIIWALQNGCKIGNYAYRKAYSYGYLDVMQWLEGNNYHNQFF